MRLFSLILRCSNVAKKRATLLTHRLKPHWKRRRARIEPLEDRRMLSANPFNLVELPGTTVITSSSYPGYPGERAIDGDLNTSWFTGVFDAANLGTTPFLEVVLPTDATVSELRMFGNREYADGYDFFAGVFQLFDDSGEVLYDSGNVDLPAPDRDITLDIPQIEDVRRVRFTGTDDESIDPGFAELEVIGNVDLTLSINDVTSREGDSSSQAVFDVNLSSLNREAFTVDYQTRSASAKGDYDYVVASGSITFAPGQTSGSISIPILNDADEEPLEIFTVNISTTAPGITVVDGQGIGRIIDDDAPITINDVDLLEDNTAQFLDNFAESGRLDGPAGLLISLDGNLLVANLSGEILRYDLATGQFIDVFATYDELYSATDLVFGPDNNLYVTDFADNKIVRFNGQTGAFIDVFAISDQFYTPVSLSFGPDANGDDYPDLYVSYTSENRVLRFDGRTGSQIDEFISPNLVELPDDLVFHDDGYLYLRTFDKVMRFDPVTGAFVDVLGPGSLGGFSDMSFGPDGNGDGVKDLYVVSNGSDDVRRYDGITGEFIDVYASAPGLTGYPWGLVFGPDGNLYVSNLTDNIFRFTPHPRAMFTVNLASASSSPVTIDYQTADITAAAADDYLAVSGTVTFPPGQTEQTFDVPIVYDPNSEPFEVFGVNLTNASGGLPLVDTQGVGGILDNGPQPGPITVLPRSLLVTTEAGGAANFVVMLDSVPAADVTIPIISGDPSEGAVSTNNLTFTPANWFTPQTVTVTGVADDFDDGDIYYPIQVGPAASADPNFDDVDPLDVTALNTNFGTVIVEPTSGLATSEPRGEDSFTLKLSQQPTGPVVIQLATSNPAEGLLLDALQNPVETLQVAFDDSNWNQPHLVRIQGVDDQILELETPYQIAVTLVSSADPAFVEFDPPDVSLINIDNETAVFGLTIDSPSIFESAGLQAATATLTRDFNIGQPLVVQLSSSDISEATVPASIVFLPGQVSTSFPITVINDTFLDGPQDVIITASATRYDDFHHPLIVKDHEILFVSVGAEVVAENAGPGAALATVRRTNTDNDEPLTVTVFVDDESELAVPQTVTIPAGEFFTTFLIDAVDDSLLDGTQSVVVGANHPGYFSVGDIVQVADHETLTVVIDDDSLPAAGGLATTTGQVSRNNTDIGQRLSVQLVASDTTQANVPTAVTIHANESSASFVITSVDDGVEDGPQIVAITASADGYVQGMDTLTVTDEGALVVNINNPSIAENAGATTATVTRIAADLSQPLTVTLSSSDATEANVPTSVIIPAGHVSAEFPVSAVDDDLLDGLQTVEITAVFAGMFSVPAMLDVTDHETLTLTIDPDAITEGGGGGQATITRSNQDNGDPLTVTLTGGNPSEAVIPSAVVIPAGESSVIVSIDAVNDMLLDGPQTVQLEASSAGYVGAQASLDVLDNDRYGHNVDDPFDVNADGLFDNRDVNDAVNLILLTGGGALDDLNGVDLTNPLLYPDVDDNGFVVFLDALRLISHTRQLDSVQSAPSEQLVGREHFPVTTNPSSEGADPETDTSTPIATPVDDHPARQNRKREQPALNPAAVDRVFTVESPIDADNDPSTIPQTSARRLRTNNTPTRNLDRPVADMEDLLHDIVKE